MKGGPIDAPIVSLQDVLDDGVGGAKRHVVGGGGFLPERGDVPNTEGLIEGGGDEEIVAGMERGAHHYCS